MPGNINFGIILLKACKENRFASSRPDAQLGKSLKDMAFPPVELCESLENIRHISRNYLSLCNRCA